MISLDHATFFNIAKDIALGVNFLHGSTPSIVHYDLKPANILVTIISALSLTEIVH